MVSRMRSANSPRRSRTEGTGSPVFTMRISLPPFPSRPRGAAIMAVSLADPYPFAGRGRSAKMRPMSVYEVVRPVWRRFDYRALARAAAHVRKGGHAVVDREDGGVDLYLGVD